MLLKKALDDKKLDLRLRDRLQAEGKVTQKEIQDYLDSLEDSTSMADFSTKIQDKD